VIPSVGPTREEIEVIAKAEMMHLLAKACPSFRPVRERSARYWKDEDESTVQAVLADLAKHVISLLERADTTDLPAVFGVIERCQMEGDPFVRETAAPQLLEILHAEQFHVTTAPEQFRPFLGSESIQVWNGLDATSNDLHD
jgi:hypothetical protein